MCPRLRALVCGIDQALTASGAPDRRERLLGAERIQGLAADIAARCGVTRLAEVTQLDRLGVPVFQAVRPWSRSLSLHQGKGLDRGAARLGALMEAIETSYAEAFVGPQLVSTFADLAPTMRAPTLSDFAHDRADPPAEDVPFAWVQARAVAGGSALWAPFDVVSLDFSTGVDTKFDRSSDGLACHFTKSLALTAALLELLERDGVAEFLALSPVERALCRIDLDTIEFPWLTSLRRRLAAAEILVNVYRQRGLIEAPVLVCELVEPAALHALRGRVFGSGCDPCAESALRRAVLEAAQTRLTAISGARDDFIAGDSEATGAVLGLALPLPAQIRPIPWTSVAAHRPWRATPRRIAARLALAGYPLCAFVELSPPEGGVVVVKALVPGLGSGRRGRRPPKA